MTTVRLAGILTNVQKTKYTILDKKITNVRCVRRQSRACRAFQRWSA